MIDHALYTDIGGAKEYMHKMQLLTNNLANLNTTGFHADFGTLVHKPTNQDGMQSRIIPTTGETYTDHNQGPVNFTGRQLDVAIDGAGFFAVQNQNGQEGLTRAGNFEITAQGLLITHKGDIVLGDDGIINIPPASQVKIDNKGIITAKLRGEPEANIAEIGRLKLVNPDLKTIHKGEDGLFYKTDGGVDSVGDVKLQPESLEGSNVNAISALAQLVDISRQFDFQTKTMHIIEENATKANDLMDIQR